MERLTEWNGGQTRHAYYPRCFAVRKLYSAKVRTFFCGHTSAVRGGDDDGHIHMIRTTECDIPMQKFGKTVLLSREEAKKALREMEGKKDGKT